MEWDLYSGSLRLSLDNQRRILAKVHRVLIAQNISQWNWESFLHSLNYAMQVLPFTDYITITSHKRATNCS